MSDKEDSGADEGKPNGNSVTSVPCTCRYLQRAADEPANPIVFDPRMNEYHVTHLDLAGIGQHGYSVVFHCPYCGGAAPKSKRGTFFAHITDAESRRLRDLAAGVKTVAEAIAKFGQPDLDNPHGSRTQSPASDTEPSVVRSYRVLRYSGLSETAHVNFTDYGPDRGLHMALQSKYVASPRRNRDDAGAEPRSPRHERRGRRSVAPTQRPDPGPSPPSARCYDLNKGVWRGVAGCFVAAGCTACSGAGRAPIPRLR